MKTCPTCNRSYNDDTLSFCLHDGSILVAGSNDTQATQRIPAPPVTHPDAATQAYPVPPAQTLPPVIPSPQLQHGAWAGPEKSGGSKLWLAIGGIAALLLLAAGVGVGLILSRGDLLGGNENETKNRSNSNGASEYRSYNRSATPTSTPQPTPTPDMPIAEKLGLVGKWSGTQNRRPASLTIASGEGNEFVGIKYQGDNQVSFVGSIDPATRRMTIRETKLLKGIAYSNGKGWSLASETGTLSADGRRISGTGTDEYTRKAPYTWSYTRK
jgi:hypothetical protein